LKTSSHCIHLLVEISIFLSSITLSYPFKLFFIIFFLFLFMYPFFFPSCFTIFFSCCSSKSPLYQTSVFPSLLFCNLCTFVVKPSIGIISTQSSYFLICCFPCDIFTLCPLSAICFFLICLIAGFPYSILVVYFNFWLLYASYSVSNTFFFV